MQTAVRWGATWRAAGSALGTPRLLLSPRQTQEGPEMCAQPGHGERSRRVLPYVQELCHLSLDRGGLRALVILEAPPWVILDVLRCAHTQFKHFLNCKTSWKDFCFWNYVATGKDSPSFCSSACVFRSTEARGAWDVCRAHCLGSGGRVAQCDGDVV